MSARPATLALLLTLAIALFTTACSGAKARPTAVPEGVAIGGYCPVAYVEANRPVKGVPEHAVTEEVGTGARTYWFVDRGAKDAYVKNPARYTVMFRGLATVKLAAGERVQADPTVFFVHDGKIFLFHNAANRDAFKASPDAHVQKATSAFKSQ